MFGSIGLPEVLLILVLALLIFGPKRLPEVGRTIGKGLAEFRRASTDLKRTVNAELALDEGEHARTTRRPEPSKVIGGASGETATAPSEAPSEETVEPRAAESTTPRSPVAPVHPEVPDETSSQPADAAAPEAPAGKPAPKDARAAEAEEEPAATTP
jgi:TatA/E family protein of Tat protein translocase